MCCCWLVTSYMIIWHAIIQCNSIRIIWYTMTWHDCRNANILWFVCMYVYIYIYMQYHYYHHYYYTYTIYIYMYDTYTCVYIYIYICIYMYMCVYIHIYMYMCVYIYIYTHRKSCGSRWRGGRTRCLQTWSSSATSSSGSCSPWRRPGPAALALHTCSFAGSAALLKAGNMTPLNARMEVLQFQF